MNRKKAIKELRKHIATLRAIQVEILLGATRWEEQIKDFRGELRDMQIKLDKLREEMDA